MIVGDQIVVQNSGLLVINKSDVINTAYASSENNETIYKWKEKIDLEMFEVDCDGEMGTKVAKVFTIINAN